MAFVNKSAHPAAKSRRGPSVRFALGTLLACSVFAGSVWGLAVTLGAMHEAAHTLSEGTQSFKIALADQRQPEFVPTAVKSARFRNVSEGDMRGYQLSAEAILSAHQKTVAAELALADKRERADRVMFMASAAAADGPLPQVEPVSAKPSVMAALVEDVPALGDQPFDLVLASRDGAEEEELVLPDDVPLPLARPLIGAALSERTPAEKKPTLRNNSAIPQANSPAKPERTLFGSLFGRDDGGSGWPGKRTRVAIYDVSNATVYMPDGTKLRAHSGIGHMRDNPRYEHVKMTGPTPAGIYRLTMREKRFYGVEAIRMTSIDGRDPKNRTGLLTHTNLLRGQKGSHGCVAFQNYEPFLKAFKRGEINMMVVVPELPSSRNQLAALYRKAGA